jgi:site-specific DNA-adenine methylase
MREYREPFVGSAAVLAWINRDIRRWIGDANSDVTGFHEFVRDDPRAETKIMRLVDFIGRDNRRGVFGPTFLPP